MNAVEIGKLIRETRKKQGLTQQELAALSGVGIRFLQDVEKGKDNCYLGKTLNVLMTLGLVLSVHKRGEV